MTLVPVAGGGTAGRGVLSQTQGRPTSPSQGPATVSLTPGSVINTDGDVNIDSVNGTTLNLGQTVMAASLPVAIASNQSPIPVTGTITSPSSSYNHITTNTTTSVKASPGTLVSVIINTKGAALNTATIKDGSAIISVIDTTVQPGSFIFNCTFATSLSVVTATGTAPDITVVFQ